MLSFFRRKDPATLRFERISAATTAHEEVVRAFNIHSEKPRLSEQMVVGARAIRSAEAIANDDPKMALALLAHVTLATTQTPHVHSSQMEDVRWKALDSILKLAPQFARQHLQEALSALAITHQSSTGQRQQNAARLIQQLSKQ